MSAMHPDDLPHILRRTGRLLPRVLRHSLARGLLLASQYKHVATREFRANRKRLRRLQDLHHGETCIIMGNGPSLKKVDFSLLKSVTVFGMNRGYLLWEQRGFTPDYYVAINKLVLTQFRDEIARIPAPKFFPWSQQWQFAGASNALFLVESWNPAFSGDLMRAIWLGPTVTFTALQIAWFMGFRKVILVGVDHDYAFQGAPNEQQRAQGPDRNHFDESYFPDGAQWNLPDLPASEVAYRMAKEAFERDGRTIINATEGGSLELFPRLPLEQALNGQVISRGPLADRILP